MEPRLRTQLQFSSFHSQRFRFQRVNLTSGGSIFQKNRIPRRSEISLKSGHDHFSLIVLNFLERRKKVGFTFTLNLFLAPKARIRKLLGLKEGENVVSD